MAKPHRQQERHEQRHRRPPLSRHPLFPAIVALWFAALVGLGSFALSPALIERAVLATGLDAAIPAAAPPLGMTARLLLALALGATGGAIGWAAAWRLAHAHDAPASKVFSVRDTDLDDERLPWPSSHGPRASAEPAGPILDPASLAAENADQTPASEAEPGPALEPAPEPTAAERIASADLRALSPVELVERLAIALRHRHERRGSKAEAAQPRDRAPALGEGSEDGAKAGRPVVRFPDIGERHHARVALSVSAPPPQETEKALREALAQLQRMSGRG